MWARSGPRSVGTNRLPEGPACETIVCEDGSVDGSLAAWDDRLTRRNDFLVRSNDLRSRRAFPVYADELLGRRADPDDRL